MAASVFDSVGLILPFAIRIRYTVQKNIKERKSWDQSVWECYQQELQQWMEDFDSTTSI